MYGVLFYPEKFDGSVFPSEINPSFNEGMIQLKVEALE